MKENLIKSFRVADFFDNARWGNAENHYELINYYKPENELSNNVRILTHWICYITDRQMPFESIWDIGGFVFSNLIDELIQNNDDDSQIIDKLLKPDGEESFFISKEKYREINPSFEKNEGFLFVSKAETRNNIRLRDYGFKQEIRPYFISRYYPSDYYTILSTLILLKKVEFKFAKLIVPRIKGNKQDIIRRILFTLYLITYYDISQVSLADKPNKNKIHLGDYDQLKNKAINRAEKIFEILDDEQKFTCNFNKFNKSDKIFFQKRAWCALRDYFKFHPFKNSFIELLQSEDDQAVDCLFDKDLNIHSILLRQFELPGDVWNNNDTFRECVFNELYDPNNSHKIKLNRRLREYFNEIIEEKKVGYPEQFDITFDFVPRMCKKKNNCKICPFGKIVGKGEEFEKLCMKDSSKYCPIVYVSCNYQMMCKGEDCELLKVF